MKQQKEVIQKRVTGGGDVVYGIGLIGALVYYLQHATGFVDGLVGVVKAFLWPAFLVFQLLDFFKL